MGINFPSTPAEGQTLTLGGVKYVYKSGTWRAAPLKTALPFNYFVNGSLQASQEIGNGALLAGSGYPADCWLWAPNPGGIMTISRVPVRSGDGSQFRLRLVCTTVKTSYAAAEYQFFLNRIEGNRVAEFQWGTPNAKPAVLRFRINMPTAGTYSIALRNNANNRSLVKSFSTTSVMVDQDIEWVFAIPGDTGGVWDKGTGTGIDICFTVANGTTYATNTLDTWIDGNFIGRAGLSPATQILGRTIEFSDFGFYLDPEGTGLAPPWELVPDRQALLDSQRYWQKCMGAVGLAINNTVTHQRATYPNQATMRMNPAAALVGAMRSWDQATAPAITSFYGHYSNKEYFEYNFNSAAAQILGRGAMLLDTNGSSIFIAQNARL